MKKLGHFIANQFQNPSQGEYFEKLDPARNKAIALIPRGRKEDVDKAVQKAQEAQSKWKHTSITERANLLKEVAREIEKNIDEFSLLESLDTGKPIQLAKSLDIPRAISNFNFFAEFATHRSEESFKLKNGLSYIVQKPLGVVGLITPWNLPLYLLSWKLAPALMMGNAVVAKPSELTPSTAHKLAEIFKKLSAPEGLFNIVHGYGAEAGQALIEHKDVKAISFTGGTSTGSKVLLACVKDMKKVSLELGGKNPTIIFDDINLKKSIQNIVRASYLNQGQICLCGSRLFVHKNIVDNFVEEFEREVHTWKIGNPQDHETRFGSLISTQHLAKIESFVEEAKQLGGRILFGGKRPKLSEEFSEGAYYEPTLISGLEHDSRVVQEEIFGPVVSLHSFETEEEALHLANQTKYGLSASIWTQNLNRAHNFAQKIDCATVWINTWLMRDLRVPFGGVKDSGMGREGGEHSLNFFSEAQTICLNLGENP